MEAIANMIRMVVILLVIAVVVGIFVLPIVVAVHHHAGAALLIDILVGEVIAFGVVCYLILALFAKGMSR